MSDPQIFDPTDELLKEYQSPGLKAIRPTFEAPASPPILGSRDSSLGPPSEREEVEGVEEDTPPHESSERQAEMNSTYSPASKAKPTPWIQAPELPPTRQALDLKPPPGPTRLQHGRISTENLPARNSQPINIADGKSFSSLPTTYASPPETSSEDLPDTNETLLSHVFARETPRAPLSVHSPSLTQAQNCKPFPNPGSSPGKFSSHPLSGKIDREEGLSPLPSTVVVIWTSGSVSAPASSPVDQSLVASYSNPTAANPEMRPDRPAGEVLSIESGSQQADHSEVPFSTNSVRCTIEGCTAAPFKTQYLLNSHMNVHSDARPHFCPEQNCARGPGGLGFKRKNEMIR